VVQAFEERDGGIAPIQPRGLRVRRLRTCLGSTAGARSHRRYCLVADRKSRSRRLGPPEVLLRIGVIPDEYETGGGVE